MTAVVPRAAVIALLAMLLLAPAAAAAEGKPAGRQCADADLEAASDNLPRIRAAILCLHNRVRAEHDLPPLRANKRLRRAAVGHSRSMVAKRFFAHESPRGSTMVERIRRARYVRAGDGWTLGENLAWGTGSLGTPRSTLEAWMDSRGHRANLLNRAFRDMGVGVVLGVPVSDAAGATYTVDFGVRR